MLETERLIVRKIDHGDFKELHKMFRDPAVMKYVADTKSEQATDEWISLCLKSYREKGYGPWAVILKDDDNLIGYCGIYLQENIDGKDEVELLYGFKKEYWRCGYATEAAKVVFAGSRDIFEINRLISLVEHGNLASAQVAKKVGMKIEKDVLKSGRNYHVYAINAHQKFR